MEASWRAGRLAKSREATVTVRETAAGWRPSERVLLQSGRQTPEKALAAEVV